MRMHLITLVIGIGLGMGIMFALLDDIHNDTVDICERNVNSLWWAYMVKKNLVGWHPLAGAVVRGVYKENNNNSKEIN